MLENITNREITKMSHLKKYASVTLILRIQVSLNVDNGHISLHDGFFEIDIIYNNQTVIACGK